MSDNKQPHIGFIGLGLMGSAMLGRLQDLDYPVTVLGRSNRTPIDAAVARGATEASNGQTLAAASDIVMLCMDTSESVESRIFGDDGIIAGIKPGTIVIDFGTSMPSSTKKIGEALNAAGARYMDAPLGRTPTQAKDGLLNIMAAGAAADFAEIELVLKDLGENVFHVGPLGAGHTLKLINNFFGMTLATAMSEAFVIGDLAGIDRSDLYKIMSAGPLHSTMMDFIKINAIDGKPDALAFSIANANKDIGYYSNMAQDLGVSSFIGPATKSALAAAVDSGFGDKDVPVLVDFIESKFTKNNA